ncbi:hypothetical protein DFH09DRAFT_1330010 [Mycena vulgaris]|nr:hypothetical protein DFH09DRAFT_1330010 [Mycena vulgaris]
MLLSVSLFFSVAAFAIAAPQVTYVRVYHTITDVAPYIVDATTTMVVTPGASTTVSDPTGPGATGV